MDGAGFFPAGRDGARQGSKSSERGGARIKISGQAGAGAGAGQNVSISADLDHLLKEGKP